MRHSFAWLAIALFVLESTPAPAADVVSETHACLKQPFSNNDNFLTCLSPAERAGERAFSDVAKLTRLTNDLNEQMRQILKAVRQELPSGKRKRFESRLNEEGFAFYAACIKFQTNSGVSKDLTLARCGFDAELWTLHFLFDNYRKPWEATK